ncbi:MAG: peptidase family S49-domain-containing protein [Monoraphidium minutum]|nr:MAG: peptidase family S49-domain-containing protein [Monoraphidium minutum]
MASEAQKTPDQAKTPLSRAWSAAKKLGRAAFVIGGVLYVGTGVYAVARQYGTFREYVTLPDAFYLELDFETSSLVERARSDPLSLLRGGGPQLELGKALQARALDEAKRDARVQGLLALLGDREQFAGLAQVQELRDALIDFRGRMAQVQELRDALIDFRRHAGARAPAVAFSNSLGEGGTNATAMVYLASAFDRAYVAPTGMVSLLGFGGPALFYKRLLDKVGVVPRVFRREEYKSAASSLVNEKYDEHARANMEGLLGDLADQVIGGIAAGRRLPPEAVAAALSEAPLSAPRAAALGLIDSASYRDQLQSELASRAQSAAPRVAELRARLEAAAAAGPKAGDSDASHGGEALPLPLPPQIALEARKNPETGGPAVGAARYLASLHGGKKGGAKGPAPKELPAVVVVNALGQILQSAPGQPGLGGQDKYVESHKVVRALQQLRRLDHVKAVVLRINSPGGSAVASDAIHRELQLLVAAGKPVIASMGDVAASGGYYIAAPATRILAQPGTITGSIGVIMTKMNASAAAEMIGVTTDTVKVGANADWTSPFQELTPEQEAAIDAHVEGTYVDFLKRVAVGRAIPLERVRALAKGRVYTGRQALEAGLVDELGGVGRTIELARAAAGLPPEPEKTQLLEWPPRKVPPALALLRSSGMLPAPDSDPAPAPPPAASLGRDLGAAGGGGGGGAGWGLAAADAAEMLELFLAGPGGRGWGGCADGGGCGGGGGGGGGAGGSGLAAAADALASLLWGRALGGGAAARAGAADAAAATAAAAMGGGGDDAAAAALLRVLPRSAVRGLAALAGGGGGGGLQMMCLEAEALAMCC